MGHYRSAQGKTLDMSIFMAQNERVRAVGNMGVNARGDVIDSEGKVIQSVNDKINEYYSDTVQSKAIDAPIPKSRPVAPAVQKAQQQTTAIKAPPIEELSQEEKDLEEELSESLDSDLINEDKKQ